MKYYFAPLEGITDAAFRRIHHKHFGGVDRYFMPFISPTIHRCFTHREARECPPADSVGFSAVPQLLGKSPEDMAWAVEQCRDLGYDEVNINLGCPSGTVVAKGKGSGMLSDPEQLDRFLGELFGLVDHPISIKTRIGLTGPDEFPRILEIYNQYPIQELTVHPRVRRAFYKGSCHMEMFRYAVENSRAPVCYNGDLRSLADIRAIEERFPKVESVMLGRGLIANPGLLTPEGTTPEKLEGFVNELMETYVEIFGSKKNTMFRMKENWFYLLTLFEGSERLGKQLRKTTDYDEFRRLTHEIIHTLPIRQTIEANW